MNFYTSVQKVLCSSTNTFVVVKSGRRARTYLAAMWGEVRNAHKTVGAHDGIILKWS